MANDIQAINDGSDNMQIYGIDTNDFAGMLQVTSALNVAASLDKTVEDGQAFEFIGVIFKDGVNEQTGDPCKETYLVQRDGSALFSKSGGIYDSAVTILGGLGKWLSDGLWVTVVEIKTGRGNTLKRLNPVAPPAK